MKKVIVSVMCLGMLFSCTVPSYSSFLVLNEEKQKESVEKDGPPVEESPDTEKKESVPEKENPSESENSEEKDVPAPEEKKESAESAGTATEIENENQNVPEVKEPENKEEDVKSESENQENSQVVEKTEGNENPEKTEDSEAVVKPEGLVTPENSESSETGKNPENKDAPELQEKTEKEEVSESGKNETKKRRYRKWFWEKESPRKEGDSEQSEKITETEKESGSQTVESETSPVEKPEETEPVKETENPENKENSETEIKEEAPAQNETGTESETEGSSPEEEEPEKKGDSESEIHQSSGTEAAEPEVPEDTGKRENTEEPEVPETPEEKNGPESEPAGNETPGKEEKHEEEDPVPEIPKETEGTEIPEKPGESGGTESPEESGESGGTEITGDHETPEEPENIGIPEAEPEPVRKKSEWTTVIYMAADNDLEIAAIQDINEIEAAGIDDEKMTVLVLIDRAEGYDFTNDDWTDTRLLKIVKDPSGLNGTIVSERLDCPDLDLYKNKNTELDMGNSYTLSALLNFARREYEAEHYALIMWGHGTGWRAADYTQPVNPRAVGIDDKTGTYLSVPAFADAVHEKDLDVIAYDTCFGSVIENLYEIRDEAKYVVGAAGITPSCGFNYSDFINDFVLTDLSPETFVLALSKTSKVPVTITDCTGIKRIADAVNAFGKALADSIVTPSDREREFEVLFRKTKSYISSSYPCDMFLDLFDMAEQYITDQDDPVSEKAEELRAALKRYTRTTGSPNPEVGINFIPMYKKGVAATAHSPEYFQQTSGSYTGTEKSQFVQEMGGWVPTRKGISLLDKLFYSIF